MGYIVMDDAKRENNKLKRSKSDVKNVVSAYLQRRNYPSIQAIEISKAELLTHSLVENEVGRPNSILYSCYNSDPIVIENNFIKFLSWLKDMTKNKHSCHDIEYLVGPLFCHLYLDILRGGHSEKAASFFKCHLPAIDKSKCDVVIQELINSFAVEGETSSYKEQFRSHKYLLQLSSKSLFNLKKFVLENCHVVFLQVLQTWFDIQEHSETENEIVVEKKMCKETVTNSKFSKMLNAIKGINSEQQPVFNIHISNTKHEINCGVLHRPSGMLAFAENNVVQLRPIHNMDSLFNHEDDRIIKLTGHSEAIYQVVISDCNNVLASCSADHNVCIFKLPNLEQSLTCSGHLGPVYCVRVSSNGQFVVSGSHDTTARLWSIETGQTIRVFTGHTQAVTCVDIHPNCLYVATGSADGNIRLWSVDNGNPVRLLHGSKGTVYSVLFCPTGQVLASAAEDKKIRIWDLTNCKETTTLKTKDDTTIRLAWSEDGKQLCGGSLSGVVRIWDFARLQENYSDNNPEEPVIVYSLNSTRLLYLDYSFGNFGTLTA